MVPVTLIWNRTHKDCTGCNTGAVWVSARCVCEIHLFLAMRGQLKRTNGVRPDLVSNGVLGWGSMYGYVVCVCVCVHVLDPVVQLMVFMCILVRSHAKSQVWVTVAGQNAKTGRWADFAWWKKRLLMLWLISKTAVIWPHIHMSNLKFAQSCERIE